MIRKVALLITFGIILWLAGAWAFAFWRMIEAGYVEFVEPNQIILYTEFYAAVFLTITSLFVIVIICKKEGGTQ